MNQPDQPPPQPNDEPLPLPGVGQYENPAVNQSSLRDHLLHLLGKEERRIAKLKLVREKDVAKHQVAVKGKLWGDLIKQNLPKIARKLGEVTLTGYDDTGCEVTETIPLDVKLTPKENMEACFRAYKKGLKGLSKAGMLLEDTRGQLTEVRKLLGALETLPEEHLDLFTDHAKVRSLWRADALVRPVGKADQLNPGAEAASLSLSKGAGTSFEEGPFAHLEASLRPRVFESIDGWTILCGKGARANDYLTMRIANGNDWFFHIAGHPGAHIILRNNKGQTPPLETLLDCGQLCLHYSKQKNAGSASVHYVQKKFVSKPKGAKPGLVFVHGGKTISIRKEDERLTRLLGKLM